MRPFDSSNIDYLVRSGKWVKPVPTLEKCPSCFSPWGSGFLGCNFYNNDTDDIRCVKCSEELKLQHDSIYNLLNPTSKKEDSNE